MSSPLSDPTGPMPSGAARHDMPTLSLGRMITDGPRRESGERFDEVYRGKASDIDDGTDAIQVNTASGLAAPESSDGIGRAPHREAAPSDDTALTVSQDREGHAPHVDHEMAERSLDARAPRTAGLSKQRDPLHPEADTGDSPRADMADPRLAAPSASLGENVAERPVLPPSQRPASGASERAAAHSRGTDQGNSERTRPGRTFPGVTSMGFSDVSSDTAKIVEAGTKTGESEGQLRPGAVRQTDFGQASGSGIATALSDTIGTDRSQSIGTPNRNAALPVAGAGGDSVRVPTPTTGEAGGRILLSAEPTETPSPASFSQADSFRTNRLDMRHAPALAIRGDAADPREQGARTADPMRPAMPGQTESVRSVGVQSQAALGSAHAGMPEHPFHTMLRDNASDAAEHGVQDIHSTRDTRIGPSGTQPASSHRPEWARHVAVQIAEAARGGGERPIDLNLNPAELGRVRITLSGADGLMNVTVSAERGETLDLMRRHIDLLSDAFRDIGYGGSNFAFSRDPNAQDRSGSGQSDLSAPPDRATALLGVADITPPPRTTPVDRLDIRL